MSLRSENGGELVHSMRKRAGLTQRALAERLGRPQPMIARWERGHDSPRLESLAAIATACGMEIDLNIRQRAEVDRTQIRAHLRLTPTQRLQSVANLSSFVHAARRRP